MKTGLRLPDYLDLEWFLEKDRAGNGQEGAQRERAWGVQAREAGFASCVWPEFWLEKHRELSDTVVPSVLFLQVRRLAFLGFGLLAFLAGVVLLRGLLAYSGRAPVNVSVFFLIAIAPQMLFCLLSVPAFIWKFSLPQTGRWSILSFLLQRKSAIPGLPQQAAFFRHLVQKQGRYGQFFLFEGIRMSQAAGLLFSLGMLVAFGGAVLTTDLAFGWQSTLQGGAAGMHQLVQMVGFPWSFLPASWELSPTFSQIAGSRIVLKDGIAALTNEDLAAWWPFLSASLVTYAVVPRALLLLWAQWRLYKMQKDFEHPAWARIVDRMSAPLLVTNPRESEAVAAVLPLGVTGSGKKSARQVQPGAGCVVLLPEELQDRLHVSALEEFGARVCGYPVQKIENMPEDEEAAKAWLARADSAEFLRIVLLVEAWQPPIREVLLTLGVLGEDAGRLQVVLVGRPAGASWLTSPSETEVQVWKDAVARLPVNALELVPLQP